MAFTNWRWMKEEWDEVTNDDKLVEVDITKFEQTQYYANPSLYAPDGTIVISCSEYNVFSEKLPRPKLQEMMRKLNAEQEEGRKKERTE